MLTLGKILNDFCAYAKIPEGTSVDVHTRSAHGSTALHFMAFLGNDEGVKLLAAAGADPNAQDADGDTPLHVATSRWQAAAVLALLACGADANVKNRAGETPEDMARGIPIECFWSWGNKKLRIWLFRIFLALLLLDGVLLLCGVKFGTLAVIHAPVGIFHVFAVAYFYTFKNGLKPQWSWSLLQKIQFWDAYVPCWLFFLGNFAAFAVLGSLDEKEPKPQPAPPALMCPAPGASATPASAAAQKN